MAFPSSALNTGKPAGKYPALFPYLATNSRERLGVGYGGVEYASACRGQLEEPYVFLSNRNGFSY
jgi:hypothetical protein